MSLVVHDWGGLIGLRWACDHPEAIDALVISDTGFFPDGKWRGPGEACAPRARASSSSTASTGRASAAMLGAVSTGIAPDAVDEYFKAFADEAAPQRPARALPLGRLREARALRGQARASSASRR